MSRFSVYVFGAFFIILVGYAAYHFWPTGMPAASSYTNYPSKGTDIIAFGDSLVAGYGADDNHDGIYNDRPLALPRNTVHGPGLINLDLNIERDFLFVKGKKEGPTLTVGLNSFNVLNHRNDATYVGILSSVYFGKAVSALPPRRMQLNLQFKF